MIKCHDSYSYKCMGLADIPFSKIRVQAIYVILKTVLEDNNLNLTKTII